MLPIRCIVGLWPRCTLDLWGASHGSYGSNERIKIELARLVTGCFLHVIVVLIRLLYFWRWWRRCHFLGFATLTCAVLPDLLKGFHIGHHHMVFDTGPCDQHLLGQFGWTFVQSIYEIILVARRNDWEQHWFWPSFWWTALMTNLGKCWHERYSWKRGCRSGSNGAKVLVQFGDRASKFPYLSWYMKLRSNVG